METLEPLTLRDIADLLFAARSRVDFYWNFYVIVVIAVIGWLVARKKKSRPMTLPVKLLVTVGFLIAATMNFVGLYGAYTLAEALRTDLLRLAATTPLTDTRLVLEQHSYLAHRAAALWAHLSIGAVILFAIWFGRFFERAAQPQGGSDGA
jgi:hypothetical protein